MGSAIFLIRLYFAAFSRSFAGKIIVPVHLNSPPSSYLNFLCFKTLEIRAGISRNAFVFAAQTSARTMPAILKQKGERGGSVVECRTSEREVRGSRPTSAVLCPWARHFTPRKYWLITQEVMAPSRHDWKIVDWDVKPQHNQPTKLKQKILSGISFAKINKNCPNYPLKLISLAIRKWKNQLLIILQSSIPMTCQ